MTTPITTSPLASEPDPMAIVRQARTRLDARYYGHAAGIEWVSGDEEYAAIARSDVPALCNLAEEQARETILLREALAEARSGHIKSAAAALMLDEIVKVLETERAKDRAAFESHVAALEGDKAHLNEEVAKARVSNERLVAMIDEMHDRLNKAANEITNLRERLGES